jgi:hypothetical protein
MSLSLVCMHVYMYVLMCVCVGEDVCLCACMYTSARSLESLTLIPLMCAYQKQQQHPNGSTDVLRNMTHSSLGNTIYGNRHTCVHTV